MAEPVARPCITCHNEIEPQHQAFTVAHGGGCVCNDCWDAEPGIDTTGERYASHKAVKRFMLEHDGDWWRFPEPEPGKAQMRAIATVTPPVQGWCVHCGTPVAEGQGAAECLVAGTPLTWLANHCWYCYDTSIECAEMCTMLEEPQRRLSQTARVGRSRDAVV